MKVSKEDILHIANLANLEIKDDEIEQYALNLQDILNFADIINNADVGDLDVTVRANEAKNRFRKDEVVVFDNMEGLLQNAVEVEQNMIKLPKVIN